MRRAFTLVELLVAIALIGVLAALLLPALGRARGAARRVACVNNLHQINLAMISYADDHANSLRAATNDFHIYFTYQQALRPYLSQNGSSTNNALFACPADNVDCSMPAVTDFFYPDTVAGRGFCHLKQTDYSSYILNGEAASAASSRVTGKAFASVRQPSRLLLVSELSGAIGLSIHDRKQSQQFNNAKNVMGFVDGHVSFIPIYWNGKTGAGDMPVAYNPPAGYDYVWFDK